MSAGGVSRVERLTRETGGAQAGEFGAYDAEGRLILVRKRARDARADAETFLRERGTPELSAETDRRNLRSFLERLDALGV